MIILKEPTEQMNGEVTAINIKRNAPDADGQLINPALKLTRAELMLPTANYRRLQESRSPSPLPEPRSRIPSGKEGQEGGGDGHQSYEYSPPRSPPTLTLTLPAAHPLHASGEESSSSPESPIQPGPPSYGKATGDRTQ